MRSCRALHFLRLGGVMWSCRALHFLRVGGLRSCGALDLLRVGRLRPPGPVAAPRASALRAPSRPVPLRRALRATPNFREARQPPHIGTDLTRETTSPVRISAVHGTTSPTSEAYVRQW